MLTQFEHCGEKNEFVADGYEIYERVYNRKMIPMITLVFENCFRKDFKN